MPADRQPLARELGIGPPPGDPLAPTLTIVNGEKVQPTFSRQEYQRRIGHLRGHMEETGVDAAVFTSMHNIAYFSDFLYCSFGRNYALVVSAEDNAGGLITVSAKIDAGQPWRRSFGDNLVYSDWQRGNFFRTVTEALSKAGVTSRARIGIEFDHVSLQVMEGFREALEGCEFVDIAQPSMRQRMVKSPEEIALIEEGARIADIGGEACVEAIAPGVGEHEVALHSTEAMVREIARSHPHTEIRDTWTWFQSGINTDGAHNPVTTRRIEAGDILSLNCFPMIAGYYAALERTLFCREASEAHLKLWEVNCRVHRRGLELIRPGTRCCDIARELNGIYAEEGLLAFRTFGYGHSFGVLSHYYGREAGLELREDVETVLEPGMVVSMEPMIMIPEGAPGAGGYREHDILVVTDKGARNITGFPFGPEHNIVG